MMNKHNLLFFFTFSLFSVTLLPLTSSLVERPKPGGKTIKPHEFPWMVEIYKFGKFECGGALLSPEVILTTASCSQGPPKIFSIAAGDHWLNFNEGTEQGREVSGIRIHEMFNKTETLMENDIALMYVRPPFEINKVVKAVKLPSKSSKAPKSSTAIRWATKRDESTLRKYNVSYVDPATCRGMFESRVHVDIPLDNTFCYAQRNTTKICRHDRGTPVLCGTTTICGIKSMGRPCDAVPDLYTDVRKYLDWINENLNIPPQPKMTMMG